MRRRIASISPDGRELQPEHVIDEDLPVVVGLGEAVARRDAAPRGRAAASGRADRDWHADGRASGRRGSSSARAGNRASPGGPAASVTSTPRACAPALIFSPTLLLERQPSCRRGRRRSRHWRRSASRCAATSARAPRRSTASFGSFSSAKKPRQPASTRARVSPDSGRRGLRDRRRCRRRGMRNAGTLRSRLVVPSRVTRRAPPRPFSYGACWQAPRHRTRRLGAGHSALQHVASVSPSLAGDGETRMPAASIAAILSSAPPLPPEMMAPA